MLMNLMYHGVGRGKHENPIDVLDAHFAYLKRFPIVVPEDKIESGLHVCITFDDAREDFFTLVYPLLQKHSLKALLAVPTGLVDTPGFCTWTQLEELRDSKCVQFASHSHTHPNLLEPCNLPLEIDESKEILENRLDLEITTFVYPYGRWSPRLLSRVNQKYKYSMRIGSGYAKQWAPLMMRIPADQMKTPSSLFQWHKKARFHLKSLSKQLFERNIG